MNHYTCMWKYESSIYAYQTDSREIANKMKRRHRFYLFNEGIKCNHWVFHTKKKNQRDAVNTLRTLTDKIPFYNEKLNIWLI